MKHSKDRPVLFLCFSVALTLAACGKSGSSSAGGSGGKSGGGGSGGPVPTGCAQNVLKVVFSPMYSAFDGVHHFQIPVVVEGFMDQTVVDWSASDPSMVDIADDDSTGGIMVTAQKAGTVSIIASAGGLCGASLLTITQATPDEWMAGSARYNSGVKIDRIPIGMGPGRPDAGTIEAACTSCHGDTAAGAYKTVQHTPEQAGGFSDAELKDIFMNGKVPAGGYFDTKIVSYMDWQRFHRWAMTEDEARGIIVYLRSLTPAAQTGASNFGNRFDGGVPDGGGRGRDGGQREGGRDGFNRPEMGQGNDVADDAPASD